MLSLEEGLEASVNYRQMLEDILGIKSKSLQIEAYVDNKSVIEAILSTRMVEDKRLRVEVAAIQELQLANMMTKQGASGFHLLSVLQSGKMLNENISD